MRNLYHFSKILILLIAFFMITQTELVAAGQYEDVFTPDIYDISPSAQQRFVEAHRQNCQAYELYNRPLKVRNQALEACNRALSPDKRVGLLTEMTLDNFLGAASRFASSRVSVLLDEHNRNLRVHNQALSQQVKQQVSVVKEATV